MAYIGKQPVVGNFVKLDAITTSATATYNLTNGGVAYFPQTANNCIVSLNGVIQSPTSAYTISGSTIVFDSALTSADSIDFILVLGDVLSIGTPSDGTVGFAKVTSNLITGATAETSIAGGDSVLIYDDSASALRKMTRTNFVAGVGGTNTPAFMATMNTAQTLSHNTQTKVQFSTEVFDTNSCYDSTTNYRFTPTESGKYFFGVAVRWDTGTDIDITSVTFYKNGSAQYGGEFSNIRYNNWFNGTIISMNGTTDYVEAYAYQAVGGNLDIRGDSNQFFAYKLIGV